MATPRSAFGTLLEVGNGASPEVFTAVALVGNITGPGMKADTIDVSNHNQPNQYKQFIAGLKEGGDLKFELFFDPTDPTQNETAGGLLAIFEARSVTDFRLMLPISPGHYWSFQGVITGFDNKYDVNGAMMASCTIKISGQSLLT